MGQGVQDAFPGVISVPKVRGCRAPQANDNWSIPAIAPHPKPPKYATWFCEISSWLMVAWRNQLRQGQREFTSGSWRSTAGHPAQLHSCAMD
jgi:hypothetical protein